MEEGEVGECSRLIVTLTTRVVERVVRVIVASGCLVASGEPWNVNLERKPLNEGGVLGSSSGSESSSESVPGSPCSVLILSSPACLGIFVSDRRRSTLHVSLGRLGPVDNLGQKLEWVSDLTCRARRFATLHAIHDSAIEA